MTQRHKVANAVGKTCKRLVGCRLATDFHGVKQKQNHPKNQKTSICQAQEGKHNKMRRACADPGPVRKTSTPELPYFPFCTWELAKIGVTGKAILQTRLSTTAPALYQRVILDGFSRRGLINSL